MQINPKYIGTSENFFKIKTQLSDFSPIKDEVTKEVIMDLVSRAKRGEEKYNTTLHENNHDNFTQHLYEELLDAAQYCKKQLLIRDSIQDLIQKYPNDQELGEAIRAKYGQK